MDLFFCLSKMILKLFQINFVARCNKDYIFPEKKIVEKNINSRSLLKRYEH